MKYTMTRYLCVPIAVAIILVVPARGVSAENKEHALVRAEVVSVKKTARGVDAECAIKDVYFGAGRLTGSVFKAYSQSQEYSGRSMGWLDDEFSRGESGVWLLGLRDDGSLFVAFNERFAGRRWPSRKGHDCDYQLAVEFGETIKTIRTQRVGSQVWLTSVQASVSSTNPYLSSWAVSSLCASIPDGVSLVFDGTKPTVNLSNSGIVALDWFLLGSSNAWRTCRARTEIYQKVAESMGSVSSNEFLCALDSVGSFVQQTPLGEDAIRVIISAAERTKVSSERQRIVLNQFRNLFAAGRKMTDSMFDLCLQELSNPDERVAKRIAETISGRAQPTQERKARILALRSNITSTAVLAEVDIFLAKQPAAEQQK